MEQIKELRLEIDRVDEEIMVLLSKRFDLSQKVIKEKELMGLGRLDQNRENSILERAKQYGQKTYKVYIELLRISKEKL